MVPKLGKLYSGKFDQNRVWRISCEAYGAHAAQKVLSKRGYTDRQLTKIDISVDSHIPSIVSQDLPVVTNPDNFGTWVRANRKANNLTAKDLGNCVGVSEAMISKIETGKAHPSFEVLSSIFNVLF